MEYCGVTVLFFVFIFFLDSRPSIHCFLITSDVPLIDLNYLVTVMRKFVIRPPSYHSTHKRVRDRNLSLRESS